MKRVKGKFWVSLGYVGDEQVEEFDLAISDLDLPDDYTPEQLEEKLIDRADDFASTVVETDSLDVVVYDDEKS